MNMDALSIVKFGDIDSLQEFLFENGMQHRLFRDVLNSTGKQVPAFPLMEANPDNLDDWLLAHQVEHQSFAGYLGLNNPFNLLDVNWNNEESFYDWISSHYSIHVQLAAALNL